MIPTLTVGFGVRGRAIVADVYRDTARYYNDVLPAQVFAAVPATGAAQDYDAELVLPAAPDAACQRVREVLLHLLTTSNLNRFPQVQPSVLDVLLVGDLREAGVSEQLDAFSRALPEAIGRGFPHIGLRTELYVLVAGGECDGQRQVTDGLHALLDQAEPAWHRLYLVSTVNRERLTLTDAEQATLLGNFLVTRTNTELAGQWRDEDSYLSADLRKGQCGSVGFSALIYPAQRYRQERANACAVLLVETAEKTSCEIALSKADLNAGSFCDALSLYGNTHEGVTPCQVLRDQLDTVYRADKPESLRALLTIGQHYFTNLPVERLPMAMANLHAFICETRLKRTLQKLDDNAQGVTDALIQRIRDEVDAHLQAAWDLQYARRFLVAFNKRLKDTQALLQVSPDNVQRVMQGDTPTAAVTSRFNRLATLVGSVPSWAAIIVKSILLALMGALPFMGLYLLFTHFILQSPPLLPIGPWLFLCCVLPVFVVVFALGWMARKQAERIVRTYADETIAVMNASYVTAYDQHLTDLLLRLLQTLDCFTLDEASLARDYPGYDRTKNEPSNLTAFQQRRAALLETLRAATVDVVTPPWQHSIDQYFFAALDLNYRQQLAPDWPAEVTALLQNGFIDGWRDAEAAAMADKVYAYLAPGLAHIDRYTLAHYQEHAQVPSGALNRLVQDLLHYSAPYLDANKHELDRPTTVMAINAGPAHPLVQACIAAGLGPALGLGPQAPTCLHFIDPQECRVAQIIRYAPGRGFLRWPLAKVEPVTAGKEH